MADHFSGAETNQMYNSLKYLLLLFGMPIIAYSSINSKEEFIRFNNLLVVSLILLCSYGILEYATRTNPISDILTSIYGENVNNATEFFHDNARGFITSRITTTFIQPLDLGQFLLIAMGYLVVINDTIRKYKYLVFVLLFTNVVLTGSRSCVFPMLLLCVIAIITRIKNVKKFAIYSISILFFSIAFTRIGMTKETRETIEGFFFIWDSAKQDRLSAGGSSIELREFQFDSIKDIAQQNSLLFGRGYGYVTTEEWKDLASTYHLFGIESIMFTSILETGILGFFSFLVFFWGVGLYMSKRFHSSNGRKGWLLCITLVATYFISCMLTGNRSTMQIYYTLCFLIVKNSQLNNSHTLSLGK